MLVVFVLIGVAITVVVVVGIVVGAVDGARAGAANGNIITCKHHCKFKWPHMFKKSFLARRIWSKKTESGRICAKKLDSPCQVLLALFQQNAHFRSACKNV